MGKVAPNGFAHKNESLLAVRAGEEAFVLNHLQVICVSIPSSSSLPRSPEWHCWALLRFATHCGCCCKCDAAPEQAAEPT